MVMDPNQTLDLIRGMVLVAEQDGALDDVTRLAELVSSLDEWLSKGGFLPSDWQR